MKRGGASRHNLKNLLILTVIAKFLVFAVILVGAWFFPFNTANYSANFLDQPGSTPDLSSHFVTWDAQIYLHLARVGYSQGGFDNAFYPLFPMLIKAGTFARQRDYSENGLALSILFTMAAMGLMYRISVRRFGAQRAFWGSFFLLIFPCGFFLGLIYTESLFLALILLIVWGEQEGEIWAVALGSFLAPLCRPTGLLLALPLGVGAWRKKDRGSFLALGAWVLGVLAYLGLMTFWTGNPWAGFEAQKWSVGHFSVMNLFHPLDWFLRNFIQVHYSLMDLGTSVLDRFYFVGFLATLGMAWKELTAWERAYCLALGLVPALSGDLMSYGRYLLALYPLFLFLGKKFQGKEWVYLVVGIALQIFFILRHSLNGFVA